jgi:hypothetical protein
VHAGIHEAQTQLVRIQSEFAGRGLSHSTLFVSAAIAKLDEVHSQTIDKAMHLIKEFAQPMAASPSELARSERPTLESFAVGLLVMLPPAGVPDHQKRVQSEYSMVFQKRLDGALQDIEIGFIGGRNMITDADRRAVVLQKFYDDRHTKGWVRLPVESTVAPQEKITIANICTQLAQNGLIEWKGLAGQPEGMGRITAQGVDVIEGNAKSPIAITLHDHSVQITNSQIGSGNMQGVTISGEAISVAIDKSNASQAEKEEAKSLFQKLVDNPLVSAIINGVTGGGR